MIKIPRTKPRTTPAVPRSKLMRFSQFLRERLAEEAEAKERAEKQSRLKDGIGKQST